MGCSPLPSVSYQIGLGQSIEQIFLLYNCRSKLAATNRYEFLIVRDWFFLKIELVSPNWRPTQEWKLKQKTRLASMLWHGVLGERLCSSSSHSVGNGTTGSSACVQRCQLYAENGRGTCQPGSLGEHRLPALRCLPSSGQLPSSSPHLVLPSISRTFYSTNVPRVTMKFAYIYHLQRSFPS